MPHRPSITQKSPRYLAYQALARADQGMRVNDALHAEFANASIDGRDRRFVTELVLGSTRMKGRLDQELESCYKGAYNKVEPQIVRLLRMGLYQLRYMDKVPPHAAVGSTVDLARNLKLARAVGLINGLLRELSRRSPLPLPADNASVNKIAAGYSHPPWLVEKWLGQWDREFVLDLLRHNNTPPTIWFRRRSIPERDELLNSVLSDLGIVIRPHPHLPEFFTADEPGRLLSRNILDQGLFIVQDPSSGAVVRCVNPLPGDTIIDLCAGPGGKTAAMADLVGPEGKIIACEIEPHRAHLIEDTISRLSLTNVEVITGDALVTNLPESQKILVDAPCTGTGVMARRADLRWRRQPEHLAEFVALQNSLLGRAAELLSTDGQLIFATCSLEPEENWGVGNHLLKNNPQITLSPLSPHVPSHWLDDLGALNTLPPKHNIDGIFAINFTRI